MVQLPVGSTLEQTEAVIDEVQGHFLENEKDAVESFMGVAGFGIGRPRPEPGMAYVKLQDWDLRGSAGLRAKDVAGRAMMALVAHQGGHASTSSRRPPVTELGNATGFDFMLQDRGGLGHDAAHRRRATSSWAWPPRTRGSPACGRTACRTCRSTRWTSTGRRPARSACRSAPCRATSRTAFGSAYVNDFVQGGRVKRVYAQADAPFRMLPSDLDRLYVRNTQGGLVPLSAVASGRWVYGSPRLERYNGVPADEHPGRAGAGPQLRRGHEGDGGADREAARRASATSGPASPTRSAWPQSQAGLLYAFSILVIFLVLAALYESWTVPISILLALPLGVIGGVLASSLRGLPNDVYFQIGLLTVLGLTTKNAILIVQFAKSHLEQGMGLIEATIDGGASSACARSS